jgi:hypothetical protein
LNSASILTHTTHAGALSYRSLETDRKMDGTSTEQADGLIVDSLIETLRETVEKTVLSLPRPEGLSSVERRGIIGRYTAVLEGNFIYWMTAASLAVKSEEARLIIADNLLDEVRDSHPVMLRKFAMASDAFPTVADVLAVHDDLTRVRLFMGRQSAIKILLAMAFFEGFIQSFMPYMATLALAQGSSELEYTDVHGVCDVEHAEGLFKAAQVEAAFNPLSEETNLLEGVLLLTALLERVVYGGRYHAAA